MLSFFRNEKQETLWLKLILYLLVAIPGGAFIFVSIGTLVYIYRPIDYSQIKMPVSNPGDKHVFVLAHGVRDTTASWSDPLKHELEEKNPDARVISLEWKPYSESTLRCSVDGRRIGNIIGKKLAAGKNLESMHLIGHSCGSFVILGICEAVKSVRNDVSIQTTYLDPVSVYGGLLWNYGINRFGGCSDFSDSYIDTGDTIPGSNDLIPHTITFDVTAVREKVKFEGSPHVWPTVYYQQLVRSDKNLELRKDTHLPSKYSRGVLVKVKS
ncbi:hypothetical protein ACFL1N_03600 [Thermodesulfobacteriota bacterium]